MARKLLFGFAACTTAAVIAAITLNVNFSTKSSDLSDIALVNVEALANSEDGNCGCYGPKIYHYSLDIFFCRCENDKCCKDDTGCN